MGFLRGLSLVAAMLATVAPLAHLIELPNKLALDGPLWLAVQQHLYRGWGPMFGGPVEIIALASALALVAVRCKSRPLLALTSAAAAAYAVMLGAFFVLNDPVNRAVNRWTIATLPPDWPAYRLRWESGHALAALMSVLALVALTQARAIERRRSAARV